MMTIFKSLFTKVKPSNCHIKGLLLILMKSENHCQCFCYLPFRKPHQFDIGGQVCSVCF